MEIDIISLTGEQYALLSPEQIDKVKSAQQKKDDYLQKAAEEKRALRYTLLKNGNFRSVSLEKAEKEIDETYKNKIEIVREGLLFYLQYSAKAEDTGGTSEEYADYSLSPTERVAAVKKYYGEKYGTAAARFAAFKKDKTAPVYLGEYYAGVYDYFANAK